MMLKNHWRRILLASFYGGDGKLASVCIFPVIGHGYGTCNAADQTWTVTSVSSRLISRSIVSHQVRRGWAWSSRQGRRLCHRWYHSLSRCGLRNRLLESWSLGWSCGMWTPCTTEVRHKHPFLSPLCNNEVEGAYNTWQELERAVYCQTVIMDLSLSSNKFRKIND